MPEPLREWRHKRLYSIRGLATLAGVSPRTVQDLEAGARTPTLQTMRKLCAALDVSADDVTEFAAALAQLHKTD